MEANYTIGIDLGTTNCLLAYAPLSDDQAQVQVLSIPQVVSSGTVESDPALPSFLYLAAEHEMGGGAYDVLGQTDRGYVVGQLARSQAADLPQDFIILHFKRRKL